MKHRLATVVSLTVIAMLAAIAPATGADRDDALVATIVRARPAHTADARNAVELLGGQVDRPLPIIGGFGARVPAGAVDDLAASPSVLAVTPDDRVSLLDDNSAAISADPGSMEVTARMVGAPAMWAAGYTGRGVDVAIIDSGIAPVPGITTTGKVVNGPDLSFDAQDPDVRYLDTYGHGTHLAGIIAGRDEPGSGGFAGIAPDARLVSVKVADASGATDVSQVIAAIDWVVQHRRDNGLDIRVLNLSFGTDGAQDPRLDPLSFAVENAWRHGIVVVVAGGNDGKELGRLRNPARNPTVIAVASDDPKGTVSVEDDVIPNFSNRGDNSRHPDLVAPGRSILSLRVPGSKIDQDNSSAVVTERYFRGSGTSQSAAVVSGAAALLLQARPELTPAQVKRLLTSTARRLPHWYPFRQGAGLLTLDALPRTAVPADVAAAPYASGTGTLELARGNHHLVKDGVQLEGEKDIFGQQFDSSSWARAAAAGAAWSGGTWNGSEWAGSSWTGSSWSGSSWSGSSWSGSSWSGSSWSSAVWDGSGWRGVRAGPATCRDRACATGWTASEWR